MVEEAEEYLNFEQRLAKLEESVCQIDEDLSAMAFGEQLRQFASQLEDLRTNLGRLQSDLSQTAIDLRREVALARSLSQVNDLVIMLNLIDNPEKEDAAAYLQRNSIIAENAIRISSDPDKVRADHHKKWRKYLDRKGIKFFLES